MRSPLELEIGATWSHDRLLEEAAMDRLVRQASPRTSKTIRVRLAAGLYALAYWLAADVAAPNPAYEKGLKMA
jgi:hypothetical protein